MSLKKPKRTERDSLIKKKQNLVRQEYTDYDYLDKLSEAELDWLAKFTNENLNASFQKDNTKNLIQDKDVQNKIYNENNARNRCIYGDTRPKKKLLTYDFIAAETQYEVAEHNKVNPSNGVNKTEDILLELIELNKSKNLKNTKNNTNKTSRKRNKL